MRRPPQSGVSERDPDAWLGRTRFRFVAHAAVSVRLPPFARTTSRADVAAEAWCSGPPPAGSPPSRPLEYDRKSASVLQARPERAMAPRRRVHSASIRFASPANGASREYIALVWNCRTFVPSRARPTTHIRRCDFTRSEGVPGSSPGVGSRESPGTRGSFFGCRCGCLVACLQYVPRSAKHLTVWRKWYGHRRDTSSG
jgi:hypothetical protein